MISAQVVPCLFHKTLVILNSDIFHHRIYIQAHSVSPVSLGAAFFSSSNFSYIRLCIFSLSLKRLNLNIAYIQMVCACVCVHIYVAHPVGIRPLSTAKKWKVETYKRLTEKEEQDARDVRGRGQRRKKRLQKNLELRQAERERG